MTTIFGKAPPFVWCGTWARIAASAAPARYALFRRVRLASSAIPAVFPPVVIEAMSGERSIRELHVDGGTTAQFLSVPRQLVITNGPAPDSSRLTLYLVIDNRLGGDFKFVTAKTVPILLCAFALNQCRRRHRAFPCATLAVVEAPR